MYKIEFLNSNLVLFNSFKMVYASEAREGVVPVSNCINILQCVMPWSFFDLSIRGHFGYISLDFFYQYVSIFHYGEICTLNLFISNIWVVIGPSLATDVFNIGPVVVLQQEFIINDNATIKINTCVDMYLKARIGITLEYVFD